jgi:hypothetical protein
MANSSGDMSDQEWRQKGLEAGKVFTPTSPINAQDLFAGRDEQLRQIVDVINQAGQHAILYGERGVGKTSLANVFSTYLGASQILAPRINCDATDTFSSVWHKAIDQLQLTQQTRGIGFVAGGNQVALDPNALIGSPATPDSVRRCLTKLSQQFLLVFVIDEFDRLDADARRAFADTIKAMSDHSVNATILLVGVADSVEHLIAEHQSVQRALAQVRMPRMSSTELDSLVAKGMTKLGMTIHSAAKRRIVKLSQGLPHYAHLLALHAVRAAVDSHTVEVASSSVETALRNALVGTQQSVLTAYETAIRSARKDNLFSKVLLACAIELGEFAAQDVRTHLHRVAGRKLEIPNFAQHLKEFTELKRGPVLQKSGIPRLFRYKFVDPLLQPYVIMQGVNSGLINMSDLD